MTGTKTAREIAKQWRRNPADRLRIEREIAVSGRQAEFNRNRDGELVAKVTDDDRERRVGASFHMPKRLLLENLLTPEMVAIAGLGFTKAVPHAPHGFAIVDADAA